MTSIIISLKQGRRRIEDERFDYDKQTKKRDEEKGADEEKAKKRGQGTLILRRSM